MSLLAFDPTGVLPANKKSETHTISTINGVEYNYIVPDHAPFWLESLVVVDKSTGDILKINEDYEPIFEFPAATTAMKGKIFCGFYFTDKSTNGSFEVQIQSIGGDFVTPTTVTIQDGLAALDTLKTFTWADITPETIPDTFPPSAHTQPLTDVEVLAAMQNHFSDMTQAMMNLPYKGISTGDIVDLQEVLLTPMLSKLTDIAIAIENRVVENNVPHEGAYLYGSIVDLGAVSTSAWVTIPNLELTIQESGSYKVDWSVEPEMVPSSSHHISRLLINGTTVKPYATVNGYIQGLAVGDKLTLQIGSRGVNATACRVASTKHGVSLTAIRVSS